MCKRIFSGPTLTLFSLVNAGDDAVGIGGPDEALGRLVVLSDKAVDGGLQIHDAAEAGSPQAFGCQLGEEALHRVQPRRRGGREMEYPPRV